jgi:ATP-dependent DNA helicase RecG
VYQFLEAEFQSGRQAYVVYPLVEESAKLELKAATEMAEVLRRKVFPERRVGLLHGRLKGEEKDQLMLAFQARELDLLVATTVIEVGIDVPNATVMVIEHAERFGLSQLHQLRGRIGRGSQRSVCILMAGEEIGDDARQRLEVIRASNDGFKIAEQDLEIRGPGEFAGTRQSGMADFRFGNIVRDRGWLELARQEAQNRLGNSEAAGDQEFLSAVRVEWKRRFSLFEVG